ncbi:Clp protease N-terminal domain-containing protein [Fimbriimonas ginsengisoli]|uniref:ATP-dependent Clp protease, ATP-binding subunit ClpC n=1 Tax=Fimbriimonas ginsengisoli Gsoil 348 TaxID=661478 RepID=A0A068NWH4_FIMGI|nr:Clp protease N-terminal domain-containing protein [Fimbriimonas ginsengisoli]AIE87100.1 ATP-dependent Clp protease, ATP-binding subunit ClpC [Fimbriimonas ginsengisoli Gsoil 348]
MWQRFSERARRVIFHSQEEAQKFGEAYVSTEHILLGLLDDGDCAGYRALEHMGLDPRRVRTRVESQLPSAEPHIGPDMTLTPRAKRVIDLSYEEARLLSNGYIGSEHLFLGLVREADGLAGRVLLDCGVTLEAAREAVRVIQNGTPDEPAKQRDRFPTPKAGQSLPVHLSGAFLTIRQGQFGPDLFALVLLNRPPAAITACLDAMGLSANRLATTIEHEIQLRPNLFDESTSLGEIWMNTTVLELFGRIACDEKTYTHRALLDLGQSPEAIASAFGVT